MTDPKIIYTCPKCGADLVDMAVATYPPKSGKWCLNCGWSHVEGLHPVKEVRVPFKEDVVKEEDIPISKGNEDIKKEFTVPDWTFIDHLRTWGTQPAWIPEPCRTCPNHPSNGGSGNCNCILGTPEVYCSTST